MISASTFCLFPLIEKEHPTVGVLQAILHAILKKKKVDMTRVQLRTIRTLMPQNVTQSPLVPVDYSVVEVK